MTPNVQGPNGPYGPNYVQSAQVINNTNNYYYTSPPLPDSVSFAGTGQPQNVVTYVQNNIYSGATQVQSFMGGSAYNGTMPCYNNDIQALFCQTDQIINSMYCQPSGCSSVMVCNNQGCTSSLPSSTYSDLQAIDSIVDKALKDIETQKKTNSTDKTDATDDTKEVTDEKSSSIFDNINEKKIKAAAVAIHDAVDGLGTDEDTIFQVLEALTPEERAALEVGYAQMYGDGNLEKLRDDLDSDMDGPDINRAIGLLNKGAVKDPYVAAAALHYALNDVLGTDEDTIKEIVGNVSPAELRDIQEAYGELYGNGDPAALRRDIRDDFSEWGDGFWTGAAIGTAAGSVVPFVGNIVGFIIGGIAGYLIDPSKNERNALMAKLNEAALAD